MIPLPKNILLLFNHSIAVEGFSLLLKGIFPTTNFQKLLNLEGVNTIDFNEVDLVISNYNPMDEKVFDFFIKLKKNYSTKLIVLTDLKKIEIIQQCKNAGVNGIIFKNDIQNLEKGIRSVLENEPFYSEEILNFIKQQGSVFELISKRELLVIREMANGLNNIEIAKNLNVSIETIKTHKKNIKQKLNTDNKGIVQIANLYFIRP